MDAILDYWAERTHYRFAAIALIAGIIGAVSFLPALTGVEIVGPFVGITLYFVLLALTYQRLRDAALTGNWIWLMMISVAFGPEWHGFALGSLINLVPVLLAWIAPRDWGAHPRFA